MTSTLGTVIASNIAAFTSSCKFLSMRDNEAPSPLAASGYALQTRVGEDQDVHLFVEWNERLLGIFERIENEMQAGKREFRLVKSRDDEPDLVIAADGNVIHFEITDKLHQQHGLTRMPFRVDIDDSDALCCAAPHLCVHQILAFALIQQQGANATTTFTRCSSSLSISTVQRWNSCGIHSGSHPSATCPPSIALSTWPYATRYETAPFHRYLTSLGSRS